jgi:hypothetical protein
MNKALLSAANANNASVEDMANSSKFPTATFTQQASIPTNSTVSKTNLGNITSSSGGALKKNKTFITQASKSTIKELSFEDTSSSVNELSKLSKQEIKALSEYTGIPITNDDDLTKATNQLSTNLSMLQNSNVDLTNVSPIAEEYLYKDDPLLNRASSISKLSPNLNLGEEVMNLTSFSNMNITDALGNLIPGIPTMSDFGTVKELTNLASSICPNVGYGYYNFGQNSTLMNLLLMLAAKLGLLGLIYQLMGCTNLFNAGGINTLSNQVGYLSNNGDYRTTDGIIDIIGNGRVSNPIGMTTALISNVKSDDNEAPSYISSIMSKLNITSNDLVGTKLTGSNVPMYSAKNVNKLGNNKSIMGNLMGNDYNLYKASPFGKTTNV